MEKKNFAEASTVTLGVFSADARSVCQFDLKTASPQRRQIESACLFSGLQ